MLSENVRVVVERTVERLVKRRQRRSVRSVAGWWSDPDDLRQEGWLAALECLRRSRRNRTVVDSDEAFVAHAANQAMANYQIAMGSPVSETDHHRRDLVGTRSAEISNTVECRSTSPSPEHTLTESAWRERFQRRLDELVAADERLIPAVAARYHGASITEAAEMFGADAQELYRAIRRLKDMMRDDQVLNRLHAERP